VNDFDTILVTMEGGPECLDLVPATKFRGNPWLGPGILRRWVRYQGSWEKEGKGVEEKSGATPLQDGGERFFSMPDVITTTEGQSYYQYFGKNWDNRKASF